LKWLFTIDTEDDQIVFCRLMNAFRRKGAKIFRMSMATLSGSYCIMVLLEGHTDEIEHIFHFVRRTEGVNNVAYYRECATDEASFVFVDGEGQSLEMTRWPELFPGANLVFASHGKVLFEIPAGSAWPSSASRSSGQDYLGFSCVKASRAGAEPSSENRVGQP
jgi:hypothetical protein